MTTTEVQEKPKLSCKSRGPGPKYNLPSLVGYDRHDPSRFRNPAYSLRKRLDDKARTVGPGPKYDVSHFTQKGPERPPEFTIAGRASFKANGIGPGPGAYNLEKCPPMNHSIRPPAYSLKARLSQKYSSNGPGPNEYTLPSCLGPSIPDKKAFGAFTITGLRSSLGKYVGPSPAEYGNFNYNVVKRKYPEFSLKSRRKFFDQAFGPGPVHNPTYITGRNPPKYSFGVRHSDCAPPAITDLDNED